MMAVIASIARDFLVTRVIEDFLPRFAPDGILRYVSGEDWARQNAERIEALGLTSKSRRRLPDVLIHQQNRKRLILTDATTSQGVMTTARVEELSRMYHRPGAELVFVTAFSSRETLSASLDEIAWGTMVWLANEPDHLISLSDGNLLGPH